MTGAAQRGSLGGKAALRVAGLGLLVALGACADAQGPTFPATTEGPMTQGLQWGGQRVAVPSESLTVQRIRGTQSTTPEPLRPEDGSIWPAREAPRATLADPEDVLRGTPPRGSSSSPAPTPRSAPGSQRSDGQVIPTADGPVLTTGGVGNVRTTISPQGTGLAIQDGAVITLLTPGQPPRVVHAPR